MTTVRPLAQYYYYYYWSHSDALQIPLDLLHWDLDERWDLKRMVCVYVSASWSLKICSSDSLGLRKLGMSFFGFVAEKRMFQCWSVVLCDARGHFFLLALHCPPCPARTPDAVYSPRPDDITRGAPVPAAPQPRCASCGVDSRRGISSW